MRLEAKFLPIVIALLIAATAAAAGETKKSADLGLNFNQSSYSDSWTGDELGTMNWTAAANVVLERALSASVGWKNELKLSYGQTHQQKRDSAGAKYWAGPEKSSDRIFLESLLRFDAERFVEPYAAVTFESQFHDADDNPLTPATITESLGAGHHIMKDDLGELFTRVGFALRQETAYRVEGKTSGGLEWVTDFDRTFGEDGDLKVVSKLRVFQAFFSSVSDDVEGLVNEDYWKSPDVAWETTLSAAVSKYIQTQLFVEFLYDKEISRQGRYRQVLGLGVSYKLF